MAEQYDKQMTKVIEYRNWAPSVSGQPTTDKDIAVVRVEDLKTIIEGMKKSIDNKELEDYQKEALKQDFSVHFGGLIR